MPIIPLIMAGASVLSSILGKGAKGRAEAKQRQEQAQLQRDALALQARQLGLQAPGTRLSQGLRADLAANYKPVTMETLAPGTVHPRAPVVRFNMPQIGEGGKALANQVLRDVMAAQLRGDQWQPTAAPKSGFWDKLLGIGSGITSGLGGLEQILGKLGQRGMQSGTGGAEGYE